MTVDYEALEFSYTRSPDQAADATPRRHPVIIVGAGAGRADGGHRSGATRRACPVA